MKNLRASAIVGALVILELLTSQAIAAKAKPPTCTDSGLGGQICPFRFDGLLTKEQIQTVQQWHTQNVQQLQNLKGGPK
jgi:hypothetical protein